MAILCNHCTSNSPYCVVCKHGRPHDEATPVKYTGRGPTYCTDGSMCKARGMKVRCEEWPKADRQARPALRSRAKQGEG
jgi:hypothetical protein